MSGSPSQVELSVVIPALREADNIGRVISGIKAAADALSIRHEVIVADGDSNDGTPEKAREAGAEVLTITSGFAESIRTGFRHSKGEYILVMDGDGSHPPERFEAIWALRNDYDVIVGSRLVDGGGLDLPLYRRLLTKVLNAFFRTVMRLPVLDSSSGYRLYRGSKVRNIEGRSKHFEFQQETLLWVLRHGGTATEVPIYYQWREAGRSKADIRQLGIGYVRTLCDFWWGLHS